MPRKESFNGQEKDKKTAEESLRRLEEYKQRLKDLEQADNDNVLSSMYDHSAKYMDFANEEIADLETKIREEEDFIRFESDASDIEAQIKQLKGRIQDLENAKRDGKLSTEYHHAGNIKKTGTTSYEDDYMKQADDEVYLLEEQIRILERKLKRKGKKEDPPKPDPVIIEVPKPDPVIPPLPEPVTPPKLKKRKKLGFVETDLVEKRAREVAAERMTAEAQTLKGAFGFFKKLWVHNWGADYYRTKETTRVQRELRESGSTVPEDDIYGSIDRQIKGAIVDRFINDTPGLIHELSKEWKDDGNAENSRITPEQRVMLEQEIRTALTDYATHPDKDLAEGNFQETLNRVYHDVFQHSTEENDLTHVADNIREYAHELRSQIEQGASINELDLDFELTFGSAVTGARTEVKNSRLESLIQRIAQSPIGRFVNETTIAAAVSAASAIATSGAGMSIKVAGLGLFGGALFGGGMAAARESHAIKRDRAEHARTMATGGEFDPHTSPRRRKIHEATYDTIPAQETSLRLRELRTNLETFTEEGTTEEMLRVLSELTCVTSTVDAHVNLSDRTQIDLISYSGENEVERERMNLDIEKAESKIALREIFDRLHLENTLGNFDEYYNASVCAIESQIQSTEISEKDRVFNALRKRSVAKAFVRGATTSLVVGAAVQESVAAFTDHQHGLIDTMRGHDEPTAHATVLEWSREKLMSLMGSGHHTSVGETIAIPGGETTHTAMIGGTPHEVIETVSAKIKLPEGFHVQPGAHTGTQEVWAGGHYDKAGNLVDGKLVAHIAVDKGTPTHLGSFGLTPESMKELKQAGLIGGTYSESHVTTEKFTSTMDRSFTTQELMAQHGNVPGLHGGHIVRDWADNGTRYSDMNELKLSDPYMGKDGMIHYSVKGMTSTGSAVNGVHINPKDFAHHGKMAMYISPDKGSQFTPIKIEVGPDMVVKINPHDPLLGKLFSADEKGHVIQHAKFVEAGVSVDDKAHKVVMCATNVGTGVDHMRVPVSVEGIREVHATSHTTEFVFNRGIVSPIILPLDWRTPLEPSRGRGSNENGGENGGGPQDDKKEKKPKKPKDNKKTKVDTVTMPDDFKGGDIVLGEKNKEGDNKKVDDNKEKPETPKKKKSAFQEFWSGFWGSPRKDTKENEDEKKDKKDKEKTSPKEAPPQKEDNEDEEGLSELVMEQRYKNVFRTVERNYKNLRKKLADENVKYSDIAKDMNSILSKYESMDEMRKNPKAMTDDQIFMRNWILSLTQLKATKEGLFDENRDYIVSSDNKQELVEQLRGFGQRYNMTLEQQYE